MDFEAILLIKYGNTALNWYGYMVFDLPNTFTGKNI